jgi:DNA-binding NarL/FixJ family response regulator
VTARPHAGALDLTDRQIEVLGHLARGLDLPAIAREMQISVHTARGHLKTAMERLDAPNGTAAVYAAIRRGLLPVDIATPAPAEGASHVR